ncbi:MAG: ATP-binding cassette domain-containing protein, partial [Oscillospiraceae bacterium]|nr:ATP-binding cassette domain-containing protein [Oscillospiraceae bacterium]
MPAIELKGITKAFGSVVANDNISLSVEEGEILALLGENGSGKTTLMNMLSGIYRPDAGKIYIRGEEAAIKSPRDAFDLKIGMIHQHFKLVDALSAGENIVMGTSDGKRKSKTALNNEINKICEKFGLKINFNKKIYEMSVSEKQNVEIIKMLYRGADILILDEPTAVLTPQETDRLFGIMRGMKAEGCAIIIITHKLNEVLAVSDRVTVLRKGMSVKTVETKKTKTSELIELMVGKAVELEIECPEAPKKEGMLRVRDLTVINEDGQELLKNLSFELGGGEILGVAGVAGSGQKELCEAVAGLQKNVFGEIIYE